MMHNPNDTHETRATGAMMTAKDATLVPKGLAQRHLEVSCLTLICQNVFSAKPTPAFGWWITTSHAKRA
jgi:hypothetical protein